MSRSPGSIESSGPRDKPTSGPRLRTPPARTASRRGDGTVVVLAGQAHDFASHYASDELARRAALDGVAQPLPPYRPWMDRMADFDPARVLFAHDCSVWEPASGRVSAPAE